MKHILRLAVYFIFVIALVIPHISMALKPTPQDESSTLLKPVIHVGAGFQQIVGSILVGTAQLLPDAVFQVIGSGSIIRPALFSSSATMGNRSFFSVLQTAQFTQKVFVGFNDVDFSGKGVHELPLVGSNFQRLNLKGGLAISNLDSKNQGNNRRELCVNAQGTVVLCAPAQPETFSWKTGGWGVCTNGVQTRDVWCENNGGVRVADEKCSGLKPANSQACGGPVDNGPLQWNGNPYRQCENGKVIAYIGVVGAEGQPVEFRRGWNGPWTPSNNGNNGFIYEIPKYDNPDDKMPDTYCKEFRYRVPNLPNKSTNDINNGVWGCVNTMTHTECPDA